MSGKPWTRAEEAILWRLAAGRATDEAIAASLPGRTPVMVQHKRLALGIIYSKPCSGEHFRAGSTKDAESLPTGHPSTWGLLLALTPSLEGSPWPGPQAWTQDQEQSFRSKRPPRRKESEA
jgi:hypothetical protein